MDNQDILDRIQALVAEEHQLRAESAASGPEATHVVDPHEERRARLRRVEEELDQCWEMIRQRRAKETSAAEPGKLAQSLPLT